MHRKEWDGYKAQGNLDMGGAGSGFEKFEKMTFGLPLERESRITSRAAPGIEAYSRGREYCMQIYKNL